MIAPLAAAGAAPGAPPAEPSTDRKLRDAARQLEALFVQELFKAMRATVPQGEGIVSGGAGEDFFTSQLDQHVAASAPDAWRGGIGEALYRQLRGHALPPSPSEPPPRP